MLIQATTRLMSVMTSIRDYKVLISKIKCHRITCYFTSAGWLVHCLFFRTVFIDIGAKTQLAVLSESKIFMLVKWLGVPVSSSPQAFDAAKCKLSALFK